MYNLIYSNHRLTFGGSNVGYEIPYASITYSTVDHGTISGVATAQIGSTVTVTSIPSTGYKLSYITVNGTQIVGNSFVVTGNTVVGAVFEVVGPSYTLEISFNGTGYDRAELYIRSMEPNASHFSYTSDNDTYNYNNPTSMNSTSGNGLRFGTWYPDPTFVATAVLVPSDAYVLSFEILNNGWHEANTYTYNVTNTETQEVITSGTFTVSGYQTWNQYSITVKDCAITYSTVQHGTVTGSGTAEFGSTVNVTAVPEAGYILSYITVNGTQIEGNSFVATGDAIVGAVFVEADEVTIGSQVWKTHNLAINDNGGGITVSNSEYYYTQDAAVRVAATVTGWHLPSTEELNTLITNAGGFNGLAAAESWTYGGGNNSSGFGALAKGQIVPFVDPNNPRGVGIDAVYWSTDTSNRYSMYIYHDSSSDGSVSVTRTASGSASVRLIKD